MKTILYTLFILLSTIFYGHFYVSAGNLPMTKFPPLISRRRFLQGLSSLPFAFALAPSSVFAQQKSSVTFLDVARASGIWFRHDNAASAEKYLIETMGAGCGWIDYDQDGLLDLYLVNGAATRAYTPRQPLRS